MGRTEGEPPACQIKHGATALLVLVLNKSFNCNLQPAGSNQVARRMFSARAISSFFFKTQVFQFLLPGHSHC